MKHKKLYVSIAVISLTLTGSVVLANSDIFSLNALSRNASDNYYLDFNSSTNKFVSSGSNQSGTYVAKTHLGNDRSFTYQDLSSSSGWQLVNQNGYFYNTDSLLSVSQISITINNNSSSCGLYWSPHGDFSSEMYQEFDTSSSQTIQFNFNNYLPNYIKFVALTNCNITEMRIRHECSESHTPFTVNYHLNGSSTQSLEMSEKTNFTINRLNGGYWSYYTTDAFIYYNNNQIDTKYAHKVG